MKKMFNLFNKQRNWQISCWPRWYFCLLDWQEKSNSKFIAVDKTVELVFSHIINLIDLFNRYLLGTYISVSQFSHSVVSDSLRPHESQHARPPCPSTTPGVHSDSRPLSQWCHRAISSSVIPFSSCPQSLLASGRVFSNESALRIRWPKYWSFNFNISLPMNTQDWSTLGWTGWISLQSKGLSRVFSNTTVQKHQFFGAQLSSHSNSHIHTWPLEKP